jgi:hypothetical protein
LLLPELTRSEAEARELVCAGDDVAIRLREMISSMQRPA